MSAPPLKSKSSSKAKAKSRSKSKSRSERRSAGLYLVPTSRDGVEFNIAKFKENVQNAGHYPSMENDQQPMTLADGSSSDQKLQLATKSGIDWEGELLNKEGFSRTNTGGGWWRKPRVNHYVLLSHDKDTSYGPNGRFILHLVRQQYLFGRKRKVRTLEVEDQEKEAKKEQDRLDRLMADKGKESRNKRKSKLDKAISGLSKKLRVPTGLATVGDLGMQDEDGTVTRFTRALGSEDDGIGEFFNYTSEHSASCNNLRRAQVFDADDETADYGDTGIDDCGGDNDGMEVDPDDYLDVSMGIAAGLSDDENDTDDEVVKKESGEENDEPASDSASDEHEKFHDDLSSDEEESSRARFEELVGRYQANIVLQSNVPLSAKAAEEVFAQFLRKNNLSDTIPRGRADFLRHLCTWDNSMKKKRDFLATCSDFITVDRQKARTTITIETFRNIFRRCVGGVGPAFRLSKERIVENLKKDVGPSYYREQRSKVDQIFRESLQRLTDDSGDVMFAFSLK